MIFLRVFRPIIAFSILFFGPPCFLTFDFTQFFFVFVAATGFRKVGGSFSPPLFLPFLFPFSPVDDSLEGSLISYSDYRGQDCHLPGFSSLFFTFFYFLFPLVSFAPFYPEEVYISSMGDVKSFDPTAISSNSVSWVNSSGSSLPVQAWEMTAYGHVSEAFVFCFS